MSAMNKIKAFLLTLALMNSVPLSALAGATPTKFPTDVVQFGKSGSTSNKSLTFDFGLGASNPSLFSDNATNGLNYTKNIFNLGDGTSALKQILANTGASPAPALTFNSSISQWQFTNDGTNFNSIGSGSGSGGAGINVLTNPGFESGVTQGWSNTGGTFASVNSGANLLVGLKSATFTASATGQFITSTLQTVPNGIVGQSCSASMLYLGNATNLTFEVIDGSSNVLASQAMTNVIVPTTASVSFVCGASASQFQIKILSSAASGTVALDQASIGTNPLTQVSQAQFMGSVLMTGCASAWNTTSTSLAALPVQTACVYTLSGSAQAPATMVPGIKFASLAAGNYLISYEGLFGNVSAGKTIYLQFTDGTNTAQEISNTEGVSSAISTNGFLQNISYTTAQSNVTLQVFVKTDSGGTADIYGTTAFPGVIKVYYFPSQAQTAITASTSALSWSGYQTNSGGWTTTSATYADLSAGTGVVLTTEPGANFGTVISEGTGLPGITWPAQRQGNYFVCAGVGMQNSVNDNPSVQLVTGANVIVDPGRSTSANTTANTTLCGIQYAASVGNQTTKVRAATNGGTLSLNTGIAAGSGTIQWTIVNIDTSFPGIIIPGSVTSSSAGVERIERLNFSGAASTVCSSSPCTINSSTPAFTGVTRSGTGTYLAAVSAGNYSAVPVCTCSSMFIGTGVSCLVASTSTTTVSVQIRNSGGSVTDDGVSVICQGPH